MYFNTEKRTPKLRQDDLSRFLSLLTFRIKSVGFWHSDRNMQADYTSSDIEFVYYTLGGSSTVINDTEYRCRAGDLMILPPHSLVTSVNQGYTEYEYFYIHFNVEPYHLEDVFAEQLIRKSHVLFTGTQEEDPLGLVLQTMVREVRHQRRGCQSVIDGCLRNLCVYILRRQDFGQNWSAGTAGLRIKRQFVSDVVKTITQNLDQPLTAEGLAAQFHVSTSYLYKSFVSQLQISPQRYIKQKRLEFALKALRSNDYTVAEVASMVGFHSVSAFSSDIRRQTGKTPRQIMKEGRQDTSGPIK